MPVKGIVGGVMVLVALGLILRFGKSSNAILNTGLGGTNDLLSTLTLSKWSGNTP